ncbi:hypothetical protein MTBSS4_320044 [Magnetospirillum sp. SS-4]|nr:hypothetical protein MTBSS4_320044 [Magnetospirillum sp. SS-4]
MRVIAIRRRSGSLASSMTMCWIFDMPHLIDLTEIYAPLYTALYAPVRITNFCTLYFI